MSNVDSAPAKNQNSSVVTGVNETDNQVLTNNMINEYEEMVSQLTPQQYSALMHYTYDGHADINHMLHGNATRKGRALDIDKNIDFIKQIDRIILAHGMNGETKKLYRYIKLDRDANVDEFIENNFSEGSYSVPSFMSTTEDISLIAGSAHKFSDTAKYIVLEIETNKGISLQSEQESQGNIQSFEKERLLPRDVKFTVKEKKNVSVEVDSSRQKLIQEFGGFFAMGQSKASIPPQNFQVISLVDEDVDLPQDS